MAEEFLDCLDDPRLEPYRDLKRSNLTRWSGLFIAEGEKVVQRLLDSDYEVVSVLVSAAYRRRLPADFGARVEVLVVPQELAARLAGFQFHAGILACGRRKAGAGLDCLMAAAPAPYALIVACDRVTDPDNLGAIIRLCRGFGAQGLILGRGCADPFSRRTLRVSMGNAFALPIVESVDLLRDLRELQQRGYRLLATMLDPAARPLHEVPAAPRDVVLFGNEAHGLDRFWRTVADEAVVIPMQPGTDSLNVAVAAGIVLHYVAHVVREGGMTGVDCEAAPSSGRA